jgi:hypothetical protein
MYIPFLAKQKANAWQLAVLPCVFGMLFYFAGRYDFGPRMGGAALLGGAVALLGFALTGGLRACGMGLCLYLGCNIAKFDHTKHWAALAMGLSAYILVCLARALLPKRVLTPDAKANFKSFFWIAGVGAALFACMAALVFLLGLRE